MTDYSELDYKYSMPILLMILDYRSNFNNRFNYLMRQLAFFGYPEPLTRITKFLCDYFHFVPTCAPHDVYTKLEVSHVL